MEKKYAKERNREICLQFIEEDKFEEVLKSYPYIK